MKVVKSYYNSSWNDVLIVEAARNHHLASPKLWIRVHAYFITAQVYPTPYILEFKWIGAF
jgi:hypothetical protein